MNEAILLDTTLTNIGKLPLPEHYKDIKEHNLYLYVKSFLSSVRMNSAKVKTRAEVSGGGKKPWAQKGGGRARAGSITSPIFVGGGVAHGPTNARNYEIKINKKQKRLALEYALHAKAREGKLYVLEYEVNIPTKKTKEAFKFFQSFNERSLLVVVSAFNDESYLAFRNLKDCYLIDSSEINAYLVAAFRAVVMDRLTLEELINPSSFSV